MTEQREDRIRFALVNLFDAGNALVDALEHMMIEQDGWEIENALMGIPETVNGELRDWEYFTKKLRASYVKAVEEELDHSEEKYEGSRRLG
jgi:hypothetical protein